MIYIESWHHQSVAVGGSACTVVDNSDGARFLLTLAQWTVVSKLEPTAQRAKLDEFQRLNKPGGLVADGGVPAAGEQPKAV